MSVFFMQKEENILLVFGQRVKKLRQSKKITQDQFAKLCDLHKNYIGMIERGERNPSLINIEIIASTFEMSISELMKFD
jgi:transcriptional regulator with XRE-family HTH domain